MNLEDDVKRLNKLVRSLGAEIDYKNGELSRMQFDSDETNARIRTTIIGLMERSNAQDRRLLELEHMYQNSCCLMNQKAAICDRFRKEIRNLDSFNSKLKYEMECGKKEIKQLVKELQESRSQNDLEQTKLRDEIKQLKEKLETHSPPETVDDLRKEIKQLTEKLQESKSQNDLEETKLRDEMNELKEKLETRSPPETIDLSEKLNEKEAELCYAETLYNTLIIKERMANQELQDARKESICGLQEILNNRTTLGIKRMGALDHNAFIRSCKLKFSNEDWGERAAKLCSTWEEYLKDPHWHPFKKLTVKGQLQEVIDDEDEKLKGLRNEYGEVVYEAVTNAVMELNEYNASGRYPVREVWNLKEGRRASMKEIIQYLIKKSKSHKRKRVR